jgi:hypothetical protein
MKLKIDIGITGKNFRQVETATFEFLSQRNCVRCVPAYASVDGYVCHPDLIEADKGPLEQHLKLALMNNRE